MKKINILCVLALAVVTTSVLAQQSASNTSAQFQQQLAAVFKANVKLKDAFVTGDAASITSSASDVTLALQHTNASLLKDDSKKQWVSYQKNLLGSINQISTLNTIADQRKAFATFSITLYKSIKLFGTGVTAYYEYCPMANAYWLSDSKEIENPYYGNEMLRCGSVKETIQ